MLKRCRLALLSMLLAGCSNLGYYMQAISGHLGLMRAAAPIEEIVADPQSPAALKEDLTAVLAVREFASAQLALPENGSYRSYADLGRPFAVWNVFAAPEFSVEPHQWCMLFVGCVNYRGYYDLADAEDLAARLRQEGLDTHIGGVPAYSTLGLFNDPVLNTFLRLGRLEVARIVFHELAHQEVFAKGDSEFNESFASTVDAEGMRRWLAKSAGAAEREAYVARQRRKAEFARFVAGYRERLAVLYATNEPGEELRQKKAQAFRAMRADYEKLKASWGGWGGYDAWMAGELNNARIASLSLYTDLVPAFTALLAREGGNLPRFYRRVAELARMPKKARHQALESLLPPAKPEVPIEPPHIVAPPRAKAPAPPRPRS